MQAQLATLQTQYDAITAAREKAAKDREEADRMAEEEKLAATLIQAIFRGYLTRKRLRAKAKVMFSGQRYSTLSHRYFIGRKG